MNSSFKASSTLLLILCLFWLSGCAHRQASWSNELPARSFFAGIYHEDKLNAEKQTEEEYLLWVQRFYLGWEIYKRGWIRMTNELLEELPPTENKAEIKKQMEKLGLTISSEWAKKTKKRRIFTRHVSIWGNALLESLDRNDYRELIAKVQKDVNDLLAHRLEPDVITASRYYPEDQDNPFL